MISSHKSPKDDWQQALGCVVDLRKWWRIVRLIAMHSKITTFLMIEPSIESRWLNFPLGDNTLLFDHLALHSSSFYYTTHFSFEVVFFNAVLSMSDPQFLGILFKHME